MSRLLIASNRLPITIQEEEGELHYYPSAGGLATGLGSLDPNLERIWLGWPGKEMADEDEEVAVRAELARQKLVPVYLSSKDIELFYEGFSNKTIWPHFHYFTQYTAYRDRFWEAYRQVNQKFADAIMDEIQDGDLLWVHDYQLMLVPGMVREKFPDLSIGFFLHIPFPSYEIFRILPWRKGLLNGVLGSNLIGFHTFGYMRHFLSATYRILGHEHVFGKFSVGSRLVNADVFPMGIDYDKYAYPDEGNEELEGVKQIKELASNVKLVISIDRLDYSKGLPQRIRAFSHFLHRHPEWHGKVTLVMVVVPSRSNVDQYQDLKQEVEVLVSKINGRYGTFSWEPIRYFYRSLAFAELTTLYHQGHIALITPLRDGMNLVAKEFVASKEKSKKGVLILSEMAGAANELTEALIVNPQDKHDIADALELALDMSEDEQRERLEQMQAKLKRYNVKHWASTFLNQLQKLMDTQDEKSIKHMTVKERNFLFDTYQSAQRRLFLLDYDGTLMPFHPDPQAVAPDEDVHKIIKGLSTPEANKLVVNSGRDRDTLEKWLGPTGIDMAAEHGVWIKKAGKWNVNPGLSDGWKDEVRNLLENLVQRTPDTFIEEKDYSIAWHYRRIDRDLGQKRVREFRDVLRYLTASLDLQVLEGNKVVEIKNAGVNKGKATVHWLQEQPWDFVFAVGDDSTDEDTFKALPMDDWAFSIKVGLQQSAAKFHLLSTREVRDMLLDLAERSK